MLEFPLFHPLTTQSAQCRLLRCSETPKWPRRPNYLDRGNRPEQLDRDLLDSFNTNVVGNVHLFNLYMPLILKGRDKKVIAISSGMADIDLIPKYELDWGAPYSISKAALNAAVAKFAAQYSKDGVLFMSISPGVVATEMNNGKWFSLLPVTCYSDSS